MYSGSDDEPTKIGLGSLTETGQALEPVPLVFIEGWAAGTSAKIFSGLDDLLNEQAPIDAQPRRMLVIKCGAYSSLWDRAHEIYFALKGGTCDYGEAHSNTYAHSRYGRTHQKGLYENWSEEFPLHFAGHSFGGVTVYVLQQLLASGKLPGSPAMMRSIVTISSPLRGTPLATSIGQLDGPTAGQKRFSIGWMVAVGVHLAKTANVIAQDVYDFGADQWATSTNENDESTRGVTSFLQNLVPSKGQAFSADCAGYDLLVDSMERYNEGTILCPQTYYRSCSAITNIPLYLPPLAYCHYLVSHHPHEHTVTRDWLDNDGFIPAISQWHPKDCNETMCLHIPNSVPVDEEPPPLPGVWHVRNFDNTTHFELVDYLWKIRTSTKTRVFWNELGNWLRRVDEEAITTSREVAKNGSVSFADA